MLGDVGVHWYSWVVLSKELLERQVNARHLPVSFCARNTGQAVVKFSFVE